MSVPSAVLLVCGDLFFATKLRGVIEAAGRACDLEPLAARAATRAPAVDSGVLVVDLETPGLDLPALLAALPPDRRPRVIAFGPHVRKGLLEEARAAGCDVVLSRGQIAARLGELIEALGGGATTDRPQVN